MKVRKRPLNRSIAISTTLFILVLGLVLGTLTYISYNFTLFERYKAQMSDMLSYVETHIDHADMVECKKTLKPTEQYNTLKAFMDDVYTCYKVHALYIITVQETEEGDKIINLLTAMSPEDYAEGDGVTYALGVDMSEYYSTDLTQRLRNIQRKGMLSYVKENTDFGLDYTCVMPLRDADGRVYALLCVDLLLNSIRMTVLRHTLFYLVVILVLGYSFVRKFQEWMRLNVVVPLHALSQSVEDYAKISHEVTDPTKLVFRNPEIHTGNEVETLSETVMQMSKDMQSYAARMTRAVGRVEIMKDRVDEMDLLAYQDALTKVKNKASYQMDRDRLNQYIRAGSAQFGLVMVDLNFLKRMNDTYGHERGDIYITGTVQIICAVFDHSPVYRIGGDEFVVLLEHRDYEDREELVTRLQEALRATAADENRPAWERYSAAVGMAVFEPGDCCVDDVFKRADKLMYENKIAMKAQRRT